MIKDIAIPEVTNVSIAAVKTTDADRTEWRVYLINNNDVALENTLVASKGYGEKDGLPRNTSILRHFLETVRPGSTTLIEPIDPAVFVLNNEYWVSYYIGTQIYDKRFVFAPGTISEEKISFIKELEMEGVISTPSK